MPDWGQLLWQQRYEAVWVVGGLALLVRYRRHSRASRIGLTGVAVHFAAVLLARDGLPWLLRGANLHQVWVYVWMWLTSGFFTLATLLLVWAAVADREPPADPEEG